MRIKLYIANSSDGRSALIAASDVVEATRLLTDKINFAYVDVSYVHHDLPADTKPQILWSS